MVDQTPEDTLADFALAPLRNAGEAIEMMRLSLFDWAACAMAGTQEPVTQIVRNMCVAETPAGPAIAVGCPQGLPLRAAALLNGTASHALDYDDTHFDHIGHPSVAVISAALAALKIDQDQQLVEASLVGAEASVRVGLWLGRSHYQTGFHQTATAGAFGATIAAARLMGLTHDQTRHAIGIAATRAAGLKSQFGTMGKPYHAGLAAATGVEAAKLAQAGFLSNPDGLSGAQGFGPTHAGSNEMSAFDTLGTDWRMLAISHKFHACCHGLHAMLEALRDISYAPQDIANIEITTHPRWLTVCNLPTPSTGLEAKFSYRLTAAMALCGHDTAALESYSIEATQDPQLTALRDRVTVLTDEALTETQAQVRVTDHAGAIQEASHDLSRPIPFATRADKLRAKARALIGDREQALWEAASNERAPTSDALRTLLS